MDCQAEVRDFLRTRRDRITPQDVGIIGGGNRRVPGLRREEVAFLAGVSVDYYARLERGNLAGVSDEVLGAIAVVLRLDEAEVDHLHDLARAAHPVPARTRKTHAGHSLRPSLQRFLDSMTESAAWIRNERGDFIAGNALGRAVYAPIMEDPASQGGNNALFAFLSPAARNYYRDWEIGADDIVATLRLAAGRNPRDKALSDLIGELVTRSDEFNRRWASHNVRFHRTGVKRINHPLVGDLDLTYEGMHLPDDPGWTLFGFTAEIGSHSEERLRLLGSLSSTGAISGERNTQLRS
ncbi:helix-turn-helix transcriptional regulator [Leucobacter rhizosphaerae]|uniref:Helix-turn-helix transcriptional regulator n=1 Tax=Leucobacter rhizosphaerae TaxID=2932245 RepID=A0ABY4FTX6_9MICO|nr:helix-turn-helix transcriptional regulator [Leucobacter rhizosphaerae]UOQ59707.1 helix-turn-helix transcriptional regulator [Leucobacter rhizosphaerae]